MREFIEEIEEIEVFYENLGAIFIRLILTITAPIWILPYKFFKKRR